MKYAVVKIGGSQYKIKEGEELAVNRLASKEGEELNLTEVLLLVDDGQVNIGQPVLADTPIKAKVLSHFKGEKIRVARFKAKSRYRKVRGFRPSLTKIRIEKIGPQPQKTARKSKKA